MWRNFKKFPVQQITHLLVGLIIGLTFSIALAILVTKRQDLEYQRIHDTPDFDLALSHYRSGHRLFDPGRVYGLCDASRDIRGIPMKAANILEMALLLSALENWDMARAYSRKAVELHNAEEPSSMDLDLYDEVQDAIKSQS